MPDLRKIYGENYYKEIRSKRVAPAKGTIQNLSDEERKALSQKAHEARWGKKKEGEDA